MNVEQTVKDLKDLANAMIDQGVGESGMIVVAALALNRACEGIAEEIHEATERLERKIDVLTSAVNWCTVAVKDVALAVRRESADE